MYLSIVIILQSLLPQTGINIIAIRTFTDFTLLQRTFRLTVLLCENDGQTPHWYLKQ